MTHQWPLAPFSGSKAAGFEIGGTGTGPACLLGFHASHEQVHPSELLAAVQR